MPRNHNSEVPPLRPSDLLRREFRLQRLLPGLSAGLVNGVLIIILEVSFAAMIFSGDLTGHLSRGIGLALLGAVLLSSVIALTSSVPAAVGLPQDGPTAILAVIAATIATSAGTSPFPSIIAAIAVSSLLTGILFFLLGTFGLGNLVRFVPHPVVGGFSAGIGWLLVLGGLGVMTGSSPTLADAARMVHASVLIKWLPGLAFAVLMLVCLERFKHFLLTPLLLLTGLVVFYVALFLTGTPLTEAAAKGWFLGPFPEGRLIGFFPLSELAGADWWIVSGQLGHMVTIMVISVLSLLLYASALEVALDRNVDLNRELKSTGIANLLTSLACGPPGYMALSLTALSHRMGSNSRLVGLFSGALCLLAVLFGASFLSLFPRPVAGSLLIFIGLDFLLTWVYRGWFKLPKLDYCLVLVILLVVSVFGFLEGVASGVMIAVLVFIVRYSRISVIRNALSGVNFQSNVDRPVPHRWLLARKGEQLGILRLQGYIFFGTSSNLLTRVQNRLDDLHLPPLRFLVMDFKHVTGVDSSALQSFLRLTQLAGSHSFTLVLTDLSASMRQMFRAGGIEEGPQGLVRIRKDLDHGVEWCEDQILHEEKNAAAVQLRTLHAAPSDGLLESTYDEMMKVLDDQEAFEMLLQNMAAYLERREAEAGEALIRQGDSPGGLYFVESGQITCEIDQRDGRKVRLRTMGMGSVVGEMALYGGTSVSESVTVRKHAVTRFLSRENLKRLEETDPGLAANLHRYMAKTLAEKLTAAHRTLSALIEE